MSQYFCLAFHFLDPIFHGRGDGGHREWPPSPLRAFQSMVAAAARQQGGKIGAGARTALEWLEAQSPPAVISPEGAEGSGYCLSVPNNAMDIVARAWCRGNYSNSGDASPATHRTMKGVRATLLSDGAVTYIWPLADPHADKIREHTQALSEIARSVTALGWGIDLAVGHGSILSDAKVEGLKGERWQPVVGARNGGLRVPVQGTLRDLIRHHQQFLARLGPDGFVPPSALSVYRKVLYRRATDPSWQSFAAFSILKPDASTFRPFDAPGKALTVAGMVRCAAKLAAEHSGGTWTKEKINAFILGHGEAKDSSKHVAVGPRRFAYLPLPTIESRGDSRARVVGSVRRVMLYCFADGCDEEITWAQRMISGQELIPEESKQAVALLSVIPANEKVVRCYTQAAATWATVTPVVLPGYDDPNHFRRRLKNGTSPDEQRKLLGALDDRIEGLLRKAIVQAGFSQKLADHAELEWRKVGFWPGTDLADKYGVPDHLKRFPRFHVKVRWRDARGQPVEIPGPVCFGGGRFYGLGLFAAFK